MLDQNPNFKGGETSFGTKIPRLQIWCEEEHGSYFAPHWSKRYARWESQSYDTPLKTLQDWCQKTAPILLSQGEEAGPESIPLFNSALINKYRDGRDSIRMHSDSVEQFGAQPLIAIVSLGQTRELVFHKKSAVKKGSLKVDKTFPPKRFALEDGSLLIMSGASQTNFLHEVPKIFHPEVKERYSITFRHYFHEKNDSLG